MKMSKKKRIGIKWRNIIDLVYCVSGFALLVSLVSFASQIINKGCSNINGTTMVFIVLVFSICYTIRREIKCSQSET